MEKIQERCNGCARNVERKRQWGGEKRTRFRSGEVGALDTALILGWQDRPG
jgi:hypothetical protein